MPSVSKSQAAFFRAAAHDPKIAAEHGISHKQASEWVAEDQKQGEENLPKRSPPREAMARKLRGKE